MFFDIYKRNNLESTADKSNNDQTFWASLYATNEGLCG